MVSQCFTERFFEKKGSFDFLFFKFTREKRGIYFKKVEKHLQRLAPRPET